MSIDISRVARAFSDLAKGSNTPIKLSHAQQCVAAALGFKSLAAYQADEKLQTPVEDNSLFVFIDNDLLYERGVELLSEPGKELNSAHGSELASTLRQAIKGLYPTASIHASWDRRVSVAAAIAGLVGLDPLSASDMDDARFEVIENTRGDVQGFQFNFDESGWDRWMASIERRHGSLSVYVPASFLGIVKGCESPTRWYIHGDQIEGDPSKYYCRSCDLFETAEHFNSPKHKDHGDRYFDGMRSWERSVARWKLHHRRPKGAVNLLAAKAVEERRAAEAARSDFHRWIEKQVGRADPVGDIAKEIMRDGEFPKTAKTRSAIVGYVEAATTWDKPIAAIKLAWTEFSAGLGKAH